MAIRSGTGSLKYPLLNQAQIVAQQSAAAASAGGSASASAYGANRAFAANKMRVQADLANSAAERQYNAYQQDQNRGFQNYQQEENRNFTAIQNQNQINAYADRQQAGFDQAKELQQGYQQFTAGQEQKSQDFQSGRDQTQFDQNTAAIEAQIQAGRMQLNPAAQDKLNKLEADRATIESDGTFTNAQVNEFMQQYRIKKAGVVSTATPTATPADMANSGTTYRDDNPDSPTFGKHFSDMAPGRTPGTLGDKGFTPNIDNSKQQENAAKSEQQTAESLRKEQDAIDGLTDKFMQRTNPETGKFFTPDEARDQAIKHRAETKKSLSPPATAPAAAPAAAQPGSAPQAPAGPVPPAPVPQQFNMQPNGARIESANVADIYGAPPPQPMPPNDSTQPARPQPVAGNYSIPADATGGGELQGNGARMNAGGQWQGPQSPQGTSKPASQQEYDAIPSGQMYYDEAGNLKRKK